ncbi:OPT/YSL family transporter [Tepidanaerobacter sp. EBM-49]|uniref:OPT/YSL family transporter n=1 Tax=Tepidanaerobacter sp. EBM-49 TaxID=1918504 RepID=UPI000A96610E|nr:OPT/YSL family transporter [Tepidanaerobacter sp. EBM-49]
MKGRTRRHERATSPETLVLSVLMAALSAIICMQIIGRIGITPNTSIIGAVVAMALARIPAESMKKFRSLERQNLVQTMTSAGGFAAANCGLLAVGIVYLFGEPNLVIAMLIGSTISTLIGMSFVYSVFDSDLYPGDYPWPPGVATAQAIIAGDEGGKKARRLIEGILAGVIGTHFNLPMAGIGIVFIANIFAMASLGIGLILRGYSQQIFSMDLGQTYIPHGVMIGAGIVSLIQAILVIQRESSSKTEEREDLARQRTVTPPQVKRNMSLHLGLYILGAIILALISGIFANMTFGSIVLWTLWSGVSALIAAILVGLAAMHSGWFPGFAITIIFLTLGLFMGFPGLPLALLSGYVASSGPCFADMGYDLKTGWILRGEGKDTEYELEGRKEQVISELIGGIVGMIVVGLFMNMHFELNLLPPVSGVFATTIKAGAEPGIVRQLALWAIPGAILQGIGGSGRSMGILFATGLLINNPIYGIGVLIAVAVRLIIGTEPMEIREAGLIAGDGLYGFFSALAKTFF